MDYRNIRAFCINLDRRPDRWAQVQQQFAALSWVVTRFPAISYAEPQVYGIDGCHAGALDSHRAVWRMCVDQDYPLVAVFEDDAVFPSDFARVFPRAYAQLPRDWRLWLFHSTRARAQILSPYIVKIITAAWGAHGYLVTKAGCQDLLNIPKPDHIDLLMTSGYLAAGGQPYGMPQPRALCFQRGDNDSNIPVTCQAAFWRSQRERFCR